MANPITWQNVDTGTGAATAAYGAGRLMDSATTGITGGMDQIKGVYDQYQKDRKVDNTAAYEAEIAKYTTPEALKAAQDSGVLANLGKQFGLQMNQDVLKNGVRNAQTSLRGDVTADNAYTDMLGIRKIENPVDTFARERIDAIDNQRVRIRAADDTSATSGLTRQGLQNTLTEYALNAPLRAITRTGLEGTAAGVVRDNAYDLTPQGIKDKATKRRVAGGIDQATEVKQNDVVQDRAGLNFMNQAYAQLATDLRSGVGTPESMNLAVLKVKSDLRAQGFSDAKIEEFHAANAEGLYPTTHFAGDAARRTLAAAKVVAQDTVEEQKNPVWKASINTKSNTEQAGDVLAGFMPKPKPMEGIGQNETSDERKGRHNYEAAQSFITGLIGTTYTFGGKTMTVTSYDVQNALATGGAHDKGLWQLFTNPLANEGIQVYKKDTEAALKKIMMSPERVKQQTWYDRKNEGNVRAITGTPNK